MSRALFLTPQSISIIFNRSAATNQIRLLTVQIRSPRADPLTRYVNRYHPHRLAPFSTFTKSSARMKAILIKDGKGPAENLYIGEEETPIPKKGQVQVKVSDEPAQSYLAGEPGQAMLIMSTRLLLLDQGE